MRNEVNDTFDLVWSQIANKILILKIKYFLLGLVSYYLFTFLNAFFGGL
jgi:hypothetical protein